MSRRICSIENCGSIHAGHGFCQKHLYRWRKYGDPNVVRRIRGDTEALFWSFANRSAGESACWPWGGKINGLGYGLISQNNSWVRAHRFAYKLMVAPLVNDTDLDHTCHRPAGCSGGSACPHRRCVNPAHLSPVTNAENHRADRISSHHRTKTHCPQGHEYTPENTKRIKSRPNARYCRECHRASDRARYGRKKS